MKVRLSLDQYAIALAMAEKSYTLKDIAKNMGITTSSVGTILSKEQVNPKTAARLAHALGVNVSQIILEESYEQRMARLSANCG